MSIGQNIKHLREKHNLSQKDLAEIIGVTDKAVSTWELDKKIPRMGAVEKMSLYFKIPKSRILDDAPPLNTFTELSAKKLLMDTLVKAGVIKAGEDLSEEQYNTSIDLLRVYLKQGRK